jgi:hypothetical protein
MPPEATDQPRKTRGEVGAIIGGLFVPGGWVKRRGSAALLNSGFDLDTF